MRRILPSMLVCVAMVVPSAVAQQIVVDIELDPPHEEMELGPGDRGSMKVIIKVYAQGFVCVQETQGPPANTDISVELRLDSGYDQYHGASLNPAVKTFKIKAGGPANNNVSLEPRDDSIPLWELDWAEDDRPQENDSYIYTVRSMTTIPSNPACPLMPTEAKEDSVSMKVVGPNRPKGVVADDCVQEDPRPECAVLEASSAPAESPGFDLLLVLVAALALGLARRRNR